MDGARSPAPDLFAALAWGSRLAPEHPADPVETTPDRSTRPELPVIGGPPPRERESAVVVDPTLPTVTLPAGEAAKAGFTPLADLLEPGREPLAVEDFDDLLEGLGEPAPAKRPTVDVLPPGTVPASPPAAPRRPTPVAFPRPGGVGTIPVVERRPATTPSFPAPGDPADSAQLVTAAQSASAPVVSRVAPMVELDDDEPVRSRGNTWAWVALSLMLAGTLGWVLYTQTDLFSGDVIAKRDAEAVAAAEADLAARKAENAAKQAEYGVIHVDSTPKGARVFDVRSGPETTFQALPIAHEYMVLVTAPGYVPRVRTVKGSELSSPVVVDLDPLPQGALAPPLPEAPPPRLADAPGDQVAALVLRSNTKDAQLALLVGYTPGVRLIDGAVEQPRKLWVALAGHQLVELTVKGRHYEDGPDGVPTYSEIVTLVPAPEVEDVEIAIGEGDPVAAPPTVPPGPAAATPAPAAPAKVTKKKKKKKKKKKRSR
jgi:hypothetical protein